ncbi:MAG: M48 family metallopeptidase [Candidatus Omnitrophota bacterium]
MPLMLENLNCAKEKKYFMIAAIFAVVLWGVVAVTIIGAVLGLLIGLLTWLGNGLLVANLKADCVKVHDKQLPDLYATCQEVCAKLNVPVPDVYVLQAGGLLNAFAVRHGGRNFVVLHADLIDAFDPKGDEVRFFIGHEIGHIKSKHILKHIFLLPVLWLPLLGPAYLRACQLSCDRFGAFAVNNIDGAIKGVMVLAGGRLLADKVSPEAFLQQAVGQRGFFVSWYELISGYQTLSQRAAVLAAIQQKHPAPAYPRHPFAYVFALFSFSGLRNTGNVFVIVAVVGIVTAVAIPNLLKAKMSAHDTQLTGTMETTKFIKDN